MITTIYEYGRVPNAPKLKDTFATIERSRVDVEIGPGEAPQRAVFTLARRSAGGFHVIVLSRADGGWHIVGWFDPNHPDSPIDLINEALQDGTISTGNIDAWA